MEKCILFVIMLQIFCGAIFLSEGIYIWLFLSFLFLRWGYRLISIYGISKFILKKNFPTWAFSFYSPKLALILRFSIDADILLPTIPKVFFTNTQRNAIKEKRFVRMGVEIFELRTRHN